MSESQQIRQRASYMRFLRFDKEFCKKFTEPVPLEYRIAHLEVTYLALDTTGAYGSVRASKYAKESLDEAIEYIKREVDGV